MIKKEFQNVIEKLKKERELFHSEDDLKFAISFIIKELFPDFQIRLEKPQAIEMKNRNGRTSIARAPIDIVMVNEKTNEQIPIELKYKTKELQTENKNEVYNLTGYGAKDIGRFSFRKDIYRIEQFIKNNKKSNHGFVLIITNDSGYYSQNISGKNVLDSNFSFHDGITIKKEDNSWNYKNINTDIYEFIKQENKWKYKGKSKYHWSCIGEKFYLLNLKNEYHIEWQDYSVVDNSKFKFCLIMVKFNGNNCNNE